MAKLSRLVAGTTTLECPIRESTLTLAIRFLSGGGETGGAQDAGVIEQTHREHLRGTPEEMTAQVRRWVPVGTSLTDARGIMERHGFTCSESSPDCLDCYLTDLSGYSVYSYHHARLTFYVSGGVSAVEMDTAFKGP